MALSVIFALICIGLACIVFVNINGFSQNTKPHATQTQDKCPSNTFDPIKLTGAIGSVKTKSIETDKLNFPMWCPLIEDKPKGWGLKK